MTAELVLAERRPLSLPEKLEYAVKLSDANMLPGQYRRQPANILWAIEYAETLRITAMAAILGIHVIDGKPGASAALISGLVRAAGHKLRITGNAEKAVAQIVRSDDPDFTFEVVFTIEDARRAGLLHKDGWKKYPASMLKARAITQVARDAAEDVLFGLHYTPEELGADVDADGNVVSLPTQRPPIGPVDDPWASPADGAGSADVGEPMVSREQMADMKTLFERREIFERAARLKVVCDIVDAQVASAEDMTAAQAAAVITYLSAPGPTGTVTTAGTVGDGEPIEYAEEVEPVTEPQPVLDVIPALAETEMEPPSSRGETEDFIASLAKAKHLDAVDRVEDRFTDRFRGRAINATLFVELAISAAARRSELGGMQPPASPAASALATILTRAAESTRSHKDIERIHALIRHHADAGTLEPAEATALMDECKNVYEAVFTRAQDTARSAA
ncbi:hypothetical protein [Catenulispora pinisilvae]|uniref:hypothetical protein n=1 Tax=Catenulispora pinisilvae TaxID=2705253 RepID=UPI001892132B|nr:hypothetical protein [Catenulispora pinisilvae]